jgi:hypothetical protein
VKVAAVGIGLPAYLGATDAARVIVLVAGRQDEQQLLPDCRRLLAAGTEEARGLQLTKAIYHAAIVDQTSSGSAAAKERLMKKAYGYVALACMVLSAGEAEAITGNDYQRLTPQERAMYVAGTLEGWIVADTVMRARPSAMFSTTFGQIVRCVSGRLSTAEVRTIVDRFVNRNPTERKQDMGQIILLALEEACRK